MRELAGHPSRFGPPEQGGSGAGPARLPRLAVVLPHLRAGGIETAAVRMFGHLHGTALQAVFVLGRREGPLLDALPPDLPVLTLGRGGALRTVPALARLLRRERVDAVYSGTNARNLACLLALRLLRPDERPALVISEHTSPQQYMAAARWPGARRRLMRRLYPLADLLVSPAEGLAEDWLRMLGVDRPPVATLPNPILGQAELDLALRVARGAGPPRQPAQVLAVGRLHPAKGMDVLLAAFARARQRRPELTLAVLGEGDERDRLQRQAAQLGLVGCVQFPGHCADVADRMARAGLLVVPSRREGFGNVVVEALNVGTPVVATDCDGPRLLLARAGAAGRLVPVGNADALGLAIADMAGDPDAQAAALAAGQSLRADYAVPQAAARFAEELGRVLARRRRCDGAGA